MNDNELQTFAFTSGISIKATIKDGQPWFIAKEVCDALDLSNPSQSVAALDADERATIRISEVTRGSPTRIIISEAGLYNLIFRSNKAGAKAFKRWVMAEVLPALRRDGVFIVGQDDPITNADTLPDLLAQMARVQAKVDAINADTMRRWARHDEEKEARSDAFRLLRGKAPRRLTQ